MNDNYIDAHRAVIALEAVRNTISSIRNSLREQMPEVMQSLAEAEAELPALQSEVKEKVRLLGPGSHEISGHYVLVKNAANSTVVDTAGLIERAMDLGEIEDLLKVGVLKYEVVAHQIARLPTKQRVRYESYLTTKTGTASVVLPPELR